MLLSSAPKFGPEVDDDPPRPLGAGVGRSLLGSHSGNLTPTDRLGLIWEALAAGRCTDSCDRAAVVRATQSTGPAPVSNDLRAWAAHDRPRRRGFHGPGGAFMRPAHNRGNRDDTLAKLWHVCTHPTTGRPWPDSMRPLCAPWASRTRFWGPNRGNGTEDARKRWPGAHPGDTPAPPRRQNPTPPTESRGPASCGASTMSQCRNRSRLLQVVLELPGPRRVAQLAQSLRLDLADAFAGDVELLAHFLESAGTAVLEPKPELQDAALPAGQ
jgi:hypothetical protein